MTDQKTKRQSSRRGAAKKTTAAPAPSKAEQEKVEAAKEAEAKQQQADDKPVDPAVVEGSTEVQGAQTPETGEGEESDGADKGETQPEASQDDQAKDQQSEDKAEEKASFTMPEGLSAQAEGAVAAVATYAEKMAKGRPMSALEGSQQQLLLYRAIQRILTLDGKELYASINSVLAIINENRDSAFHEKRLYRFIDQVKLSGQDRKCFERLLNLFITVCDPATREQALKQTDLELVASTLRNGEKEQKLIAFFGK